MKRLSKEQNDLYNLIDDLLWREWDPIGVNYISDARDEYQSYTAQIFSLAIRGASSEEISQKLVWIENKLMGLPGDLNKNNDIATKVIDAANKRL